MTPNNDKATGRVRAAGEERVDLRKMPREEAIAYLMRRHRVDELSAKFILRLKLGETTGDAFITRSDEA